MCSVANFIELHIINQLTNSMEQSQEITRLL
jgi:hypothetical protein